MRRDSWQGGAVLFNGFRNSFIFLAILLIFLSYSSTFSQSCPSNGFDYVPRVSLDNRIGGGDSVLSAKIIQRTLEGSNQPYWTIYCYYSDSFGAGNVPVITIEVDWVYKSAVGNEGAIGFNNMCAKTPTAIPAIGIDPKFEVHQPGLAVQAVFTTTEKYLEVAKGLAKSAIESFRWDGRSSVASCRQTDSGSDQNNETFCLKNAKQLQNLQFKSAEIDDELHYLAGYQHKEKILRDSLSYYNKIIAALNDPNYNGEYKTEVNRLRNDQTYQKALALKFGVVFETEPITIYRNLRDLAAARIDYLVKAPERTKVLQGEKVLNDVEIAKIRLQMMQKQCGGRVDINSCNITGDWTFIVDGDEEDWKFYPTVDGKYTGASETIGTTGIVEVYEKEAVLRWRTSENSGSYKLKLAEFCNNGNGEKRFSGSDKSITFTASRKNTTRVFVQNKPYTILHNGKYYQTTYELNQHEGKPIDVFFFKILDTTGSQVEQDGAKLWGRFVRFPATTYPDQSRVVWWIADWKWNGTKWISEDKQGVTVEIK